MRVVTILLLVTVLAFTEGKLIVKHAAIIFRHGDRTPTELYPKDPWKNESLWPVRFGQLTNVGIRQHYALGAALRKRYSMLISEKFDPQEIYVRSTDVDRTLMSAQANLAGMYPPSGDAIWNPNLMWHPIPIHTKPVHDDEVLAMKKSCLSYDQEKQSYVKSTDYRNRLSKYKGLMDYLSVNTGKDITDYEDINQIYNTLLVETIHNFSLPKWTHAVYPHKLREPACYSFQVATATPKMARLMTGPLLKEIVGKMNTVITKKNPNPLKLSIYSGHDFTIGNVLSAMGVYDGNCPVYTATIFFELLQESTTMKYYVRMLYRNSTGTAEPHNLYIPKCGHLCPFEKFIMLHENLISVDFDSECALQPSKLVYGYLMALPLCALILTILYWLRKAADSEKGRLR